MNKIVCISDLHGNSAWKEIVAKEKVVDVTIYLGDYVDSFTVPFIEQLHNLKEVIHYKKENMDKVILLIGNHDVSYFEGTYNNGTSGFQGGVKGMQFKQVFEENKELFQMAYCPSEQSELLFSHAGVGKSWLLDNGMDEVSIVSAWECSEYVNELWQYQPRQFLHNGMDGSGNNTWQTPIWIRPGSLMRDCGDLSRSKIQIVGHTGVRFIETTGKATGGRYMFCDALNSNNEYLVIKGEGPYTFKAKKISNEGDKSDK